MSSNVIRMQLATTFTEAEVKAMDALVEAVRQGKDARVLVRNEAVTSAHRKIMKMRDKARAASS